MWENQLGKYLVYRTCSRTFPSVHPVHPSNYRNDYRTKNVVINTSINSNNNNTPLFNYWFHLNKVHLAAFLLKHSFTQSQSPEMRNTTSFYELMCLLMKQPHTSCQSHALPNTANWSCFTMQNIFAGFENNKHGPRKDKWTKGNCSSWAFI